VPSGTIGDADRTYSLISAIPAAGSNSFFKCAGLSVKTTSTAELTNVEAKPIFDVSSAMEATFH
jgi:hypothetical protein